MKTLFATIAVAATMLTGGLAQAATQSAFERVTNDGVFTLTAAQQAAFGTTDSHIGFLRARASAGGTIAAGTTFDAGDVTARCTAGCSMVGAILNGDNASLTYSGGYLDALGTTTVNTGSSQFITAVAFLFSGPANVAFVGTAGTTATFNAASTRGDLDFEVAPVPLPAAAWLLAAGIGGLAAAKRRKAARAAA